jgi:SprT protein
MDFNDADKLARKLIAEHGLRRWSFRFNHGKRRLGLCNYTDKRIELSMYFVAQNDEAAVRDTVLHEIAHALAGSRAAHGPKWKAVCVKIGALPQRLDQDAVMPKGHWRAVCPGCGEGHTRFRRPPRGRTYICRACGPKKGELKFALPVPDQVSTTR